MDLRYEKFETERELACRREPHNVATYKIVTQ